MTRILQMLMRLGYKLTWPLAGLFLHNSRRVRVLLTNARGDILLVKSTYGSQRWELPGGGIAHSEAALEAAIREVREETGISLTVKELKLIGEERISSREHGWPIMNVTLFKAVAKDVSVEIHRPLEIVEVRWFERGELPDDLGNCAKVALRLTMTKK